MNGNPIYEQLNRAHEFLQEAKDAKTVAEHTAIIQKYWGTRYLDRQDAIQKYLLFNEEHLEFYAQLQVIAPILRININPYHMPDFLIVDYLVIQLMYLHKERARRREAQWISKNWN